MKIEVVTVSVWLSPEYAGFNNYPEQHDSYNDTCSYPKYIGPANLNAYLKVLHKILRPSVSCIQNSTFSPFQHSIEPPHLSFFVASLTREPLRCCFCRRTVWRTSCSKSPQNWTCKLNPSLGCDACFLAFVQRLYVLIYWYICRAVIGIGGAVKTKCRFDSFKRLPR